MIYQLYLSDMQDDSTTYAATDDCCDSGIMRGKVFGHLKVCGVEIL